MYEPNSMTTGQSYSDYIAGDYDWTEKKPCITCNGKGKINAECLCGAEIEPGLPLCMKCGRITEHVDCPNCK